jgi:hypothetical protein
MPSRKKTDGSARSFHVGVPPNKLLIWRAENVVVQLQDGVPLMHTNVGQNTAASSRKEFMVLSGQVTSTTYSMFACTSVASVWTYSMFACTSV